MQYLVPDYAAVIIYFLVLVLLIFISRKKIQQKSLEDYFLSSRKAPWYIAGTSMVATTFAADTPLLVAGLTARQGIAGNWLWFNMAITAAMTVFLFARLWRRAGILTDLEFQELRYGGKPAAVLRGAKAVYFGLFMNILVIGWVNVAMLTISRVLLPQLHPQWVVGFLATVTLLYVSMAGLRGLTAADAFQFIVAMTGSIVLAVYALGDERVAGIDGLLKQLPDETFNFLPVIGVDGQTENTGFSLGVLSFAAFAGLQWWASWYPGAEPGGGGYIAQRIMSSRDERHGVLASLWFSIAHIALRPWPWILAALAGMVLFADLPLHQKEQSYPMLIQEVLPSPWRGIMLAAFFGAYMSTLSTQINWGSSYLVNDFYKRFFNSEKSQNHYIKAAVISNTTITFLSLLISFTLLETVQQTWELLLQFGAGTGFILLLRWFWHRVNAAAEIASLVAPIIAVLAMKYIFHNSIDKEWLEFPLSLYIIVPFSVTVSLVVMFLTAPENTGVTDRFYKRVLPPGPGWRQIARRTGLAPTDSLKVNFTGWVSAVFLIYGLLFTTGSLLFSKTGSLWFSVVLLIAGFAGTAYSLRRQFS